ncbi:hypothetical protein KI387_035835 [Taxus chinensis]|uniref:NAC domain-containing protein n=1 Tax=Taxus chinensis TaxID=29808 RepID=A0AA38KR52_TAXCH|nr:hypothetical protein KI387_035835 [Taxus chinensis]
MEKVDLICEKEKHLQQLPGFRFHPTEEELVGFYLRRKVENKSFKFSLIRDLDLYAFEPWDLAGLEVNREESEWFFFVKPRGHSDGRLNRTTAAGFWKATGTEKPVHTHSTSKFIGFRKTLVFYKGRAMKGHKTDWIMNEYRLYLGENSNGGDVRLCRVYRKAPFMRSFDRRPSIHLDKRVNGSDHLYNFVEECPMSNVKAAGNLCTPKLGAQVCRSETWDLDNLGSNEWWWCCDGGTSKRGEDCGRSTVKGAGNICTPIIKADMCENDREDLAQFDALERWLCDGSMSH